MCEEGKAWCDLRFTKKAPTCTAVVNSSNCDVVQQEIPVLNAVFNGECWACGKYGHMYRDCKFNRAHNKCNLCRASGHVTLNCPRFKMVRRTEEDYEDVDDLDNKQGKGRKRGRIDNEDHNGEGRKVSRGKRGRKDAQQDDDRSEDVDCLYYLMMSRLS